MNTDQPDSAMPQELIIRPSSGLVRLPESGSLALSEIISRALVHIQTSKTLGVRHRIGEHELFGPDYRLVCSWAEELRLAPDHVLELLLKKPENEG